MSDTSDAIVGGIGAVVGLRVIDKVARTGRRRKKVRAKRAPARSWRA